MRRTSRQGSVMHVPCMSFIADVNGLACAVKEHKSLEWLCDLECWEWI